MNTSITLTTLAGLARLAGTHRAVVTRVLSRQLISPDAFLLIGEVPQPVFVVERADDVRRFAKKADLSALV